MIDIELCCEGLYESVHKWSLWWKMAEKLSPSKATDEVRQLAKTDTLDISKTIHAEDRLSERDILTGDLLYLLRNGFIYEEPERATRPDLWKYVIQGETPNSGGRTLCAVIIPDIKTCHIKFVTCYWKDKN